MTLTARPVTVSNIRTHWLPSRPLQGLKASANCLRLALTKVVRTSMAELTSQSDRFGMIPIIGFRFGISDSAKLTGQCIMQLAKRRRSMRPMVHHHCQSDPDHDDLAVGRGHWRNRWAGPQAQARCGAGRWRGAVRSNGFTKVNELINPLNLNECHSHT